MTSVSATPGLLDSSKLPNGLITVYLTGDYMEVQKGESTYKSFVIAFLNELEKDYLGKTIDEGRIAVLQVENDHVKSITVKNNKLTTFQKNDITDLVIRVGTAILVVQDTVIIRSYRSDDQYKQYIAKLGL